MLVESVSISCREFRSFQTRALTLLNFWSVQSGPHDWLLTVIMSSSHAFSSLDVYQAVKPSFGVWQAKGQELLETFRLISSGRPQTSFASSWLQLPFDAPLSHA